MNLAVLEKAVKSTAFLTLDKEITLSYTMFSNY